MTSDRRPAPSRPAAEHDVGLGAVAEGARGRVQLLLLDLGHHQRLEGGAGLLQPAVDLGGHAAGRRDRDPGGRRRG